MFEEKQLLPLKKEFLRKISPFVLPNFMWQENQTPISFQSSNKKTSYSKNKLCIVLNKKFKLYF